MKINTLLIIICTAFTILSCNNKVQTPKPHGFLRIDVPEHNYVEYNNHETFKFLRSTASTIEKDNDKPTVIALREIASESLPISSLKDNLILVINRK